MSLYEILLKHLHVAEQIGNINEINMRKKTEYIPEGFTISGKTSDGMEFLMQFDLTDKE